MRLNKRLQPFAIGLLTMLSLFVSSASACTCSHQETKGTPEATSHHHHDLEENAESHDSYVEDANTCSASHADCICEVTTSKVIAKSEGIKLRKHATAVFIKTPLPIAVASLAKTTRAEFAKPFYLSDSFYNLAPKRGPPTI